MALDLKRQMAAGQPLPQASPQAAQKLVDDITDEPPSRGTPKITPPSTPGEDQYPWGFMVKHPSFGAVRVRKDEATNVLEAAEVYRKKRCPHMTLAGLEKSGVRVSVLKFQPAATEWGK